MTFQWWDRSCGFEAYEGYVFYIDLSRRQRIRRLLSGLMSSGSAERTKNGMNDDDEGREHFEWRSCSSSFGQAVAVAISSSEDASPLCVRV